MTRSREWLLLNAVDAWLYHYGSFNTPMVEQYKQLHDELHDAYMATLNKDAVERSETPEDKPAPKSPRKRTTNASQSSAKTV